jgi:hypothetical protein
MRNVPVETLIDIAVNEKVSGHTGWVNVFASYSGFSVEKLPVSLGQRFHGGVISLEPTTGAEDLRVVHLADIPFEDELTITRDSSDEKHELSFILVGQREQKVRFRCQWRIS